MESTIGCDRARGSEHYIYILLDLKRFYYLSRSFVSHILDPSRRLEALAVHNAGASILELFLGDPHGLEGSQRGKNGSTNPHRVFALGRCNHLDLHGGWCKGDHLLGETLLDAGVHGGASGHNDVAVQVLADVHIALHDGLVGGLVHTLGLLANQGWVEEHLGAAESLVS